MFKKIETPNNKKNMKSSNIQLFKYKKQESTR